MNGKISKRLRTLANNEWELAKEETKKKITKRQVYQNIKREYMNKNPLLMEKLNHVK